MYCDSPPPPTPLLLFRGFEPGAFSLEVNKMVKPSMTFFKLSSRIQPASFRENVHWATRHCKKVKEHYCLNQNISYCNTGPACLYQFSRKNLRGLFALASVSVLILKSEAWAKILDLDPNLMYLDSQHCSFDDDISQQYCKVIYA